MAKRNRERARQEKQQEKAARKQQRRIEKAQGITSPDADGGFQEINCARRVRMFRQFFCCRSGKLRSAMPKKGMPARL